MKSTMPISNQQQSRELTIPPQSERRIPFIGSYIAVLSNTAGKDVWVSADDGIENPIKKGTGYPCVRLSNDGTTYEPAVYNRVTFFNRTDEPMTIEYILSLGPVTDTRAVIQGWLQVDSSGSGLESLPIIDVEDSDAVQMLAYNDNVRERIIYNAGPYTVWVGGPTVRTSPAGTMGLPIFKRGSITVASRAAVYFRAEGGASKICVNQTLKG